MDNVRPGWAQASPKTSTNRPQRPRNDPDSTWNRPRSDVLRASSSSSWLTFSRASVGYAGATGSSPSALSRGASGDAPMGPRAEAELLSLFAGSLMGSSQCDLSGVRLQSRLDFFALPTRCAMRLESNLPLTSAQGPWRAPPRSEALVNHVAFVERNGKAEVPGGLRGKTKSRREGPSAGFVKSETS